MEEAPRATSAVAKALALVAALGLDLGPVVSCHHNTQLRLRAMLDAADPATPGYDSGVRVLATFRDHWVVRLAKRVPDGVVECPSSVCVRVFDDSGVAELA